MKKVWMDLLGFALSACIAATGLLLPVRLLEQQEREIVRSPETYPLRRQGALKEPARTADTPVIADGSPVSYVELVAYLEDWLFSGGKEVIREPMEHEYTMEEAQAHARTGIRALIAAGALPEFGIESASFDSARFEAIHIDGRDRGRWWVWFSAEETDADALSRMEVAMDAETGLISQCLFIVPPFDDVGPYQKMLFQFADYYGLLYTNAEMTVSKEIKQGQRLPWCFIDVGRVQVWYDLFEMGFQTQMDFYLDYID